MKCSKYYMPTLREVPNDADIPSAVYLLRAGMVRKLVSGIYSFLPLGFRVLKKVEAIVREEMDRYGAQELLMSAVQPRELWEASGRWENFGPEMFRLKDRGDREFCLGPTHEEAFTDLVKNELKSYKQLPLNLYQIQTKYRDERRPRFGLVRAREFIMKDAYTFDIDENGMQASYDNMWRAYESAFDRLGLKYKVVQGDSGNMGGNMSHEFIAITPVGESTIAYCDACDYAATDEVASSLYDVNTVAAFEGPEERVLTEGIESIDELATFFEVPADQFAKTLLFKNGERKFAVVIPGDRELNLVKLARLVNLPEDEFVMFTSEETESIGSVNGYIGPKGLDPSVELIADRRVLEKSRMIVGANELNYHVKNAVIADLDMMICDDLLMVHEGDKCPSCGAPVALDKGTEVGNIFQLGDKYSKAIDATFLDQTGKARHFQMGSYGIGISRILSALVDQFHDEDGILWPPQVAPYTVHLTVVNAKKSEQMELADNLYQVLLSAGYEVLFDDRNESPGVKFSDQDLIGIPVRVVVGRDAKDGLVELSTRREKGNKEKIAVEDLLDQVARKVESLQ